MSTAKISDIVPDKSEGYLVTMHFYLLMHKILGHRRIAAAGTRRLFNGEKGRSAQNFEANQRHGQKSVIRGLKIYSKRQRDSVSEEV